ncbi:MAG TPA: hypothetical protein DCL76_08930 [Chloroflexi bacterium]|nr:hypothetical protein [Chloroflexota bacterium]
MKNSIYLIGGLIVLLISYMLFRNNIFGDSGNSFSNETVVHVSDMNNNGDNISGKGNGLSPEQIVELDLNYAVDCLDMAYNDFYNPFIQSHKAYEDLIIPLWDESITDSDRLDRLAKAKFAAQALQTQLVRVTPPRCLSGITDELLAAMGADILTNRDFVQFEKDLSDWYDSALNYLQSSSDCFDSMVEYEGPEELDDTVESVCTPMMDDLDKYYDSVEKVDKFSEKVGLEVEK